LALSTRHWRSCPPRPVCPKTTLGGLAIRFGLTAALHGRRTAALLAVARQLAWLAEAWIVGVGGVWRFAHPAIAVADGGLFGVPFYMTPAWSLTFVGLHPTVSQDWRAAAQIWS